MLQDVQSRKHNGRGFRFAIVASEYNGEYVDSMLSAARSELRKAGARDVKVVRVPGAYEVPIAAAKLARKSTEELTELPLGAVICLGVILRGETTHAAHIGEAVSRALMDLQVRYEVPMVHEVLLLESHDQARARCLDRKKNRGREAALTALAMAQIMQSI
jgi:6,7-dimethyl-8-ribityllumazine synthase